MYKSLISVILLWAGLSSAAVACEWLPTSVVQQAIETTVPLELKSQGDSRCTFSWKKEHWQAIEQDNQERIRNAMLRGQSSDQTRVSSWASISAELIFVAETELQAKQRFQNYLDNDFAKSYGSQALLQGNSWELVSLASGQAAWSKANQQLLVQQGQRLLFLDVQVEDEPEKNLALALKLSAGLKF